MATRSPGRIERLKCSITVAAFLPPPSSPPLPPTTAAAAVDAADRGVGASYASETLSNSTDAPVSG
jgi:hypothetical protein